MKCLILSVFVFVLLPEKVFNFGSSYFAPFSGYRTRSRFDYDLTRFFPEFRIPPDSERYEYHDTLIINKPSKIHSGNPYEYSQQSYSQEDKCLQNPFDQQTEKSEVYQFHHNKKIVDTTNRFGGSYGSSDLNTETNSRKDFGTPYVPYKVPPPLSITNTPKAKPFQGQIISNLPSQETQFVNPFTFQNEKIPTTQAYGSSYINTETKPQQDFRTPYVPFTVPPPPQLTTTRTAAKSLPGQGLPSFPNQQTQQFGTSNGYQNDKASIDTTPYFGASYGSSSFNTVTNTRKDFGEPSLSYTPSPKSSPKPALTLPGQLLTSLLGGGDEIKYKETDTDYYDFDETDIHRPKYDIGASRQLFAEFVKKYGKTYKDKANEEKHYQNFVQSLNTINRLNAEGGSATFDINIMSDEDLSQYK